MYLRWLPTKPDLQRTTSSLDKEVLVGFFARVNYDYKRRYLLTVSARYDGASQFAEDHKFALVSGRIRRMEYAL